MLALEFLRCDVKQVVNAPQGFSFLSDESTSHRINATETVGINWGACATAYQLPRTLQPILYYPST